MKRLHLMLSILALSSLFSMAFAQNARLQVIHNSPDPVTEMVDVYVNGALTLDDFGFRKATPFIDVPAGVELAIGLAPATSSSSADVLVTFNATLADGETYVATVNGVVDPAGFAVNPDGIETGVSLQVKAMAREMAMDASMVEFFALHGSPDAPTVDVIARDVATLVNDAPYKAQTDYLAVPPASYILDVTPAMDNETIVASFKADLSGLAGGAAVVFASGFLNPAANQDGSAFGLFAALPTGDVVPLPAISNEPARLQVIHNAADPAAHRVDVYVNDGLLLDDFRFRTATPYIDVPPNTNLSIGVAPEMSGSADDALATFDVMLEGGKTYVAIANGVLGSDMFAPNPEGKETGFTLFVKEMAKESSMSPETVDLFVLHGASDAPTVDVVARGIGTVVDNAAYGDMTDYLTVPADTRLNLDVTLPEDNSAVVASFKGGFYRYGESSAVVFASGFLNPAANENGRPFSLYAAFPDGKVIQFPTLGTARLQVIHNAADPAAEMVDVYVNGALTLDDFGFRKATPFIDVPANTNLSIGVAPSTSTSADDIIASFDVSLLGGGSYVAVANGVLGESFADNPDDMDIGFTLLAKNMARERANWSKFVELMVLHGSTDAPAVDILVSGTGTTLVSNLAYGHFTDYLRVEPQMYTLDITPAGANETVVVSYDVDLSGLTGGAATVFASGFLTPESNSNGPAFGLFAALPSGDVVEFPVATESINSQMAPGISKIESQELLVATPTEFGLNQNYPNPFNPTTTISFNLAESEFVSLKVYNLVGREVANLAENQMSAGFHSIVFNASELSSGKYFYKLTAGNNTALKQMILLK